jgi:hypothetical protein
MALNAAIEWEVRTTGNDANGGGFKAGATGVDYSQQNGPQATLSVAATVHTTTSQINVPAGEYIVSANDVGNIYQVSGGTATAGFYEITNIDVPNNRWIVDRAVGTAGQTCSGRMGGAMASPAKIGATVVGGNRVYIKAGTYSMSVNTSNVANGKWNSSAAVLVVGYDTNRAWGNTNTKPIIQATTGVGTMWTFGGGWAYNIDFDANAQLITACTNGGAFTRCIFRNARAANIMTLCTHCLATGNSSTSFSGNCFFCEAYSNTGTAFSLTNVNAVWCVARSNSGASSDGFDIQGFASGHLWNCIAVGNGRDGFRTAASTTSRGIFQNCIAQSNTGKGFNSQQAIYPSLMNRCAYYGNGTDVSGSCIEVGSLTPTGDVFTNIAGGDFSLNNTANRGALLKSAGYTDIGSAVFPLGNVTSYLDVGSNQHQDTGGGGGETSAAYIG